MTNLDKRISDITRKAIDDSQEVIRSAFDQRYGDKDEFAWLVEAFGGQRDRYLAGFHSAHMGQGFAWMPTWTADHAKALRFAREIDAKTIADVMDPPSKLRAVEHGWMAAPLPPPPPARMTERMVQALHAGISRRDWHATEIAANAIRDAVSDKNTQTSDSGSGALS